MTEPALRLFDQVAEEVHLNSHEYRKLLERAAMLHEVGLDIAHSRYHAHGAYLLQNSDIPGFTRREQLVLGVLVAQHRRKLRPQKLKELPKAQQGAVVCDRGVALGRAVKPQSQQRVPAIGVNKAYL